MHSDCETIFMSLTKALRSIKSVRFCGGVPPSGSRGSRRTQPTTSLNVRLQRQSIFFRRAVVGRGKARAEPRARNVDKACASIFAEDKHQRVRATAF